MSNLAKTEERNNFLKHSYFQLLLTLRAGVWVKQISAPKQLWDEYPHQATIQSPKAMQQSTQHCARRVGLTAFCSQKESRTRIPNADWQWQIITDGMKLLLKILVYIRPIPTIFTFALFALNHCTRFVAKLCQMLPFNYEKDFI